VETAVPGLYLASAWGGFGGFTGAMGTGAMAARAVQRRA
jgi:glycine/D-amino acid oxidase-like deaminating enzyme